MNRIETGTGRTRLTFTWQRRGQDLSVFIGGGKHHVGAAALVGRREDGSLYEGAVRLPPHREDAPALKAARALHDATGVTVCVTAGIHLDAATEQEIADILRAVDDGVEQLVQRLNRNQPRDACP